MKLKEVSNAHNLYILKVYGKSNTLIKFGYSNNIINRLFQYESHNPLIELIGTYYREDAEIFERKLHKCIKSETKYEWYEESKLDLIKKYILNELDLKTLQPLKNSFKEIVKELKISKNEDFRQSSFEKYPFLKIAIEKLGFNRIEKLEYVITNIKRELNKTINVNDREQIFNLLKTDIDFKIGSFISSKKAKNKIKNLYLEFNVLKTPNIKEFFIVIDSKKYINNICTQGYNIIDYKHT